MSLFNVRVYGVIISENKQVLVSDEYIRGKYYTKFPGGGLEFGEGTRDCLKREIREEMNLDASIGDHIYTTDFFQLSAFNPDHQIISIYYFVHPSESITCALKNKPFDFDDEQLIIYKEKNEIETFRFIEWDAFSVEQVTLPIDKIVAGIIKEQY